MKKIFLFCLLVLVAGFGVFHSQPAQAASVSPQYFDGNPTCSTLLPGTREVKFDPVGDNPGDSGSYTFTGTDLTISYVTTSGGVINWTSTFGIDGVFMKGGSNGYLYVYNPESLGDTNLYTPNNNSGNPADTSHISFCFDFELDVTKVASTSLTRTYTWDIDKEADGIYTGFIGDPAFTHDYTVAVDQTVTDSDWAVSGTITIFNTSPFDAATVNSVTDVISGVDPDKVTLNCPAFPFSIPARGTAYCTYSAPLPDGTNRTNTATAFTSGVVGGDAGSAAVSFANPIVTVVGNPTVTVTDSLYNDPGMVSGDASFTYPGTFQCPADPAAYTNGVYTTTVVNTAAITETGASDSATVTLNCYAPLVSKTAETSYTRTWNWTIDKLGDQTDLLLALGQTFVVNYDVTLNATPTDSAFAVEGIITVTNPNPSQAMVLTSVTDVLDPAIADPIVVTCPADLTVPAGGTLECSYTAGLPDATARTNTATATLNGLAFSGSAPVTFGDPSNVVDECITVSDDKYGSLGTVCADEVPVLKEYTLEVGPYATCGLYTFVNVASFVTTDTGATGSDDHVVNVDVPCAGGCTLTPGYWKTHSSYGPAPYDDNWANLPAGADTAFYLSGTSYYNVLWTAPKGNVYYILAHAYIAAQLNTLNGASTTPEVNAALAYANTFFNTYTPAQAAKLSKTLRNNAIAMAGVLDKYNNGLIGPGHCDE